MTIKQLGVFTGGLAIILTSCGADNPAASEPETAPVSTATSSTPTESTVGSTTIPAPIDSALDNMRQSVPGDWGVQVEPLDPPGGDQRQQAIDVVLSEYSSLTNLSIRDAVYVQAEPTTEIGEANLGGETPVDAWVVEMYGFAEPISAPPGSGTGVTTDTGLSRDVALSLIDAETYAVIVTSFRVSDQQQSSGD